MFLVSAHRSVLFILSTDSGRILLWHQTDITQQFLQFSDRFGWIQALNTTSFLLFEWSISSFYLWTNFGTIHNCVTTVDWERVTKLFQALLGVFIARIDDPSTKWSQWSNDIVSRHLIEKHTCTLASERRDRDIYQRSTSNWGKLLSSKRRGYIRTYHPAKIDHPLEGVEKTFRNALTNFLRSSTLW